AIHYAVAARDTVEGVDFYYYVCFARDLASGANDVPVARYMYFPGVYLFWRSVLRVAGESLSALQWAYVSLILANALVVGAVIVRVSRSIPAGVFGAIWYLILCSRFEGFIGTTEP